MEAVTRIRRAKHNLKLVFKERWQPASKEERRLYLYHKYGSGKKTLRFTPINIPMVAWNKK